MGPGAVIIAGVFRRFGDSLFDGPYIDTHHYTIDSESLEGLPPLLRGSDSEDLPDDLSFDLWLAKEGVWPVKLSFSASDTDDSGQTVQLSLEMQVKDINDPGIVIETPPADSGTQGS